MKTWLAVVLALLVLAVAACGGYWAGFRHAWSMGMRADAAPRGAIALSQLRLIDQGRLEDVRVGLEHDVDNGLLHWHDLSASPASPLLNVLSGESVMPKYERYVKRLAAHRKKHKSPLSDPAHAQPLVEGAARGDADVAAETKQRSARAARVLEDMVGKYAP